MSKYQELLDIVDSDKIQLGTQLDKLLHTHLVLGQTRHQCRYGTLSDGHEKITDSQRYYQAIKEKFMLCSNIVSQKIEAMKAQADLLDAKEDLEEAVKLQSTSKTLRAEATIMQAELRILTSLTTAKDQERMVDEYTKVIEELGSSVNAKYPLGIEQAEPDNWKAVAEYRAARQRLGHNDNIHFVPLEPKMKAQIAIEQGRPELLIWSMIKDKEQIDAHGGDMLKYINEGKDEQKSLESTPSA